jgi:hypothetical protein
METPVDMLPAKKPTKAAKLKARIEHLNKHFADPAVKDSIHKAAKDTFVWLKKNTEQCNQDQNRFQPWWPSLAKTENDLIRRNRTFQLLCRAYGNGLKWMISELISNDVLASDEKYLISTAVGYVPMAMHHELIGYRMRKEILKVHENPDDDAVGLNDVAERFDYTNATNVRDQFVDLMATFGLWAVKISQDYEIRVGPVAYAFHIHALVPILDELEPKI